MKISQHIVLEMFGVKKRIGDIKSIFSSIESNNHLQHTSLISSNNCIVFLYGWGHIIVYTSPKDRMLSVEILSSLGAYGNNKIKQNLLGVFQPKQCDTQENTRPLGNV